MSTRLASIVLNPGAVGAREGAETSDLQLMAGKVLAVLRQRRWLFIVPLLTGVLASLIFSLTLPRRYQLSTIFERRDDMVITKLVSENSPYSFATLRQSLTINLAGYNAVSEAVEQLGLTRDFPREPSGELTPEGRARKQSLVLRLSRELNVNLLEKSNLLDLIEVRYAGDDPELGVRLVTQLRENYVRNTSAWIGDILTKSRSFFQEEVARRAEQAARMEAELLETSLKHPGVDPTDPNLLHEKLLRENTAIEDLQRRKAEIQSNIEARREYLQELQTSRSGAAARRPADLSPTLLRNPEYQRIRQEIETLRAQIADARTLRKMKDEHPELKALIQKLGQLESQQARIPETLGASEGGPEPSPRDPVESDLRRTNMELKSLSEVLAQIDRELPKRQAERARLEAEQGSLFERRQAFMMRQQELQAAKSDLLAWTKHLETIARVLTAESKDRGIRFSTVEEARRPHKPTSPTLVGIFTLSGSVGLALAVVIVFLREILDRSFRSAARVRQTLGIPVLETIGEIPEPGPSGWLKVRTFLPLLASIEVAALVVVILAVYLSVEEPAVFEQWSARVVSTLFGG
ncbi:MAG: hypothetical protein HRF43_03680 [Phycisphaerae bacterium]|jgi:uncharacterized protein involved in exopolysaccharide biosynthesis